MMLTGDSIIIYYEQGIPQMSPSQARMGRYLPPCDILFWHIVQQFLQFIQKIYRF